EIEQARTEVQAQVVTAWSQLQAAKAAVESDQVAVTANRVALAGVREEERVGQRNLLVAAYSVVAAIGRLNAQELAVSSLVYDPEQHYQEVRDKWFDLSIIGPDGKAQPAPPPPPARKKAPPP